MAKANTVVKPGDTGMDGEGSQVPSTQPRAEGDFGKSDGELTFPDVPSTPEVEGENTLVDGVGKFILGKSEGTDLELSLLTEDFLAEYSAGNNGQNP